MDRARRAEPYSNATIWTREIARNFAGHLDRLSRVHSCVDSASPKSAAHHAHSKGLPLKRAGQVSPLKHERSATAPRVAPEDRDEPADHAQGSDAQGNCSTARDDDDDTAASMTPVRRRRPKALRKIKTVSKRTQLEAERHDDHHENQRLQDRSTEPGGAAAGHYDEYLEPQPVVTHAKKGPHLDYHKRQEQQRIWQENQALAKRLRNTKPTMRSKDWEKDDKWNQSFLKTQERRRQALQHEMARTLASPHSAMIRVKHAHAPGRPQTEHGVGDDAGVATTVIEVTTQDAKTASRDLRRRRSAEEDATREHRQQSSAANHRRIMELRKQREQQQHPRGEGNDSATVSGTGPTGELVSVRFTFSREGQRELGTPNGITGQFSPAVELEAALEASCHPPDDGDGGGNDDDALLLPVPTLEAPLSSRLEIAGKVDVGDAVVSALQACVDVVVSIAEHAESVAINECEAAHQEPPLRTPEPTTEEPERFDGVNGVEELRVDGQNMSEQYLVPSHEETSLTDTPVDDVATVEHAPYETETPAASEDAAKPDALVDADLTAPESGEAIVDIHLATPDAETEVEVDSARRDPAVHEMDASGYGSEFDAEESPATDRGAAPPDPVATSEGPKHEEDEEEDEYEDDHADEDDSGAEHDLDARKAASDGNHDAGGQEKGEEEEEEPQYDDDLEPEAQNEEQEQSYGDDGFADDA